jgi:hypothetical protein
MTSTKMRNIVWFLTGHAHVYYGLLIIFALGVYDLVHGSLWAGLIQLIVSVGVFVDLWAHNYRH